MLLGRQIRHILIKAHHISMRFNHFRFPGSSNLYTPYELEGSKSIERANAHLLIMFIA